MLRGNDETCFKIETCFAKNMAMHFSTRIHFLALVKHCKNYEKKTLTNDLKVDKPNTLTNTDL